MSVQLWLMSAPSVNPSNRPPEQRPVDRNSPLPLWAQVETDLRRRLGAGEFEGRFPTDMELVEQYGVSRHTVRDAVARLTDDGLLERRPGLGTVVRPPPFQQPLGSLYSLFRSIEERGVEQRSRVLALDERRDPRAAERLELPADAPLVYLRRLRYADDEPLVVDESWLPADIARPLLDADFTHTALYTQLTEQAGVRVESGWEHIRPVIPDSDVRALLELPDDEAAFAVERLARDDVGRAVDVRLSLVRGDRYGFVARWSDVSRGEVPSLERLETAV